MPVAGGGFEQCYNAQATVAVSTLLVIAADVVQALSDLVFGRDVRVIVVDRDRYGRTVGRIYVGTLDVNAKLVRMGAVWVYTRFNRDPSLLVLQAEALAAHRGLWALPESERMPPWEWRAEERSH